MSILKVAAIQNAAGVEVYTAKAWVNFNGTGTVAIRSAGNVSSITDNGVGDYTVNFATAMADANYATVATCDGNASFGAVYASVFDSTTAGTGTDQTTAAVRVRARPEGATVSNQDVARFNVAIFR